MVKKVNTIQMFVLGVKEYLLANHCLKHKLILCTTEIIDLI